MHADNLLVLKYILNGFFFMKEKKIQEKMLMGREKMSNNNWKMVWYQVQIKDPASLFTMWLDFFCN